MKSSSAASSDCGKEFDCMISYCYDTDEENRDNMLRVHRIADALERKDMKVWLDRDSNHGEMIQVITKAIESSLFVLTFITKRYIEKVNDIDSDNYCQLEFNYAVNERATKYMIPVVMENWCMTNYPWSGIVGARYPTKKYIDFTNESNFDEKIEMIIFEMAKIMQPPPSLGLLSKQKSFFTSSKHTGTIYDDTDSLMTKSEEDQIETDSSSRNSSWKFSVAETVSSAKMSPLTSESSDTKTVSSKRDSSFLNINEWIRSNYLPDQLLENFKKEGIRSLDTLSYLVKHKPSELLRVFDGIEGGEVPRIEALLKTL
jgi:5-hydroxyisourate hydrolase-like protein (transthyretin family)